jgi:hypothetical protein
VCGTPIDLSVNIIPVSKIEEKIAELETIMSSWTARDWDYEKTSIQIGILKSLLPKK